MRYSGKYEVYISLSRILKSISILVLYVLALSVFGSRINQGFEILTGISFVLSMVVLFLYQNNTSLTLFQISRYTLIDDVINDQVTYSILGVVVYVVSSFLLVNLIFMFFGMAVHIFILARFIVVYCFLLSIVSVVRVLLNLGGHSRRNNTLFTVFFLAMIVVSAMFSQYEWAPFGILFNSSASPISFLFVLFVLILYSYLIYRRILHHVEI